MSYVPKILIVDDDDRVCDSLKILLGNEGYEIQTGHNGREVLEALSKNDFDLVLLDLVLPDINAAEIMDHINSRTPETLVIVITGHASWDSAVNSLKKGVFDYLRKPFEHEELSKAIKNALEQKALKSEQKQVEEALRKSEDKYKTLVESSLTGIFIHQDGKYVFVNDRFAEIHGYTPEELLGKEHLTLIHPDERDTFAEIASARLKGKGVRQRYEVRRLGKDGKTIWCEMMAALIKYGERPAIMGNIIDISKRKRAEKKLRESEKRLYQKEKRMEILKFANDVSLNLMHELRNPLVSIGGFSRRISTKEYSEDKLKKYAKIIFEESKRLDNVLEEIVAHLKDAARQI